MHLTLVLTHGCNLACTYCYAGRKFDRAMPRPVAWKALARAFAAPGREPITVSFFGGEPMLAFDEMVAAARLARRMARRQGREIRFTITTNGTLLSERHLDFLYEYGFYVTVSLDGTAAQDRYRPFVSGRASSPVVWRNVARAAQVLDRFSVLAVLNPDTVTAVAETVERLHDLRVARVHVSPNLDCDWTPAALDAARAMYDRLARLYLERREAAWPLYVHPMVEMLRSGSATCGQDRGGCGFGDGEWAVAPSGNLYPCARLVAEDTRADLRLGTVDSGPLGERVRCVKDEAARRQEAWGTNSPCSCAALMPGDARRGAELKDVFDRMAFEALESARCVREVAV